MKIYILIGIIGEGRRRVNGRGDGGWDGGAADVGAYALAAAAASLCLICKSEIIAIDGLGYFIDYLSTSCCVLYICNK